MAVRLAVLLALAWAMAGQEVVFERVEVDATPPEKPWIKVVGDLDDDRAVDVIIGGSKGPLVWYRNPSWRKSVIAEGGYDSVDGEAVDMDGDEDLDVVIGGALWYENPRPDRGPDSGPWRAHEITKHTTHDVEAADLDGDGWIEVVLRGQSGFGHQEGHRILVCKRTGPEKWSTKEIRCPEGEGLVLSDLDRDGDADIVTGGRWYENDGNALRGKWAEHVFADEWKHPDAKVAVGDFNGDSRPDIVLAPAEPKGGSYRISWFMGGRRPAGGPWEERVIQPIAETVVHGVDTGDFNGDGMDDVAAAWMHQGAAPQEVAVFFSREGGLMWRKQVLSETGSHNIVAVDLNEDERVDVLGANHGGEYQAVEIWFNRGAQR